MRFCRIMLGCFIVILSSAGLAQAKVDWRFPVGFTYITGLNDIKNLYEDNLSAEEYEVDDLLNWPVGISFNPYVEFDYGLRIGGGIGPFSIITMESHGTRIAIKSIPINAMGPGNTENTRFRGYYCFPVNLNVGYSFLPKASISPYIKAGISYPIAWGDYIKGRKVGFLGAVGVEFMRKRAVGIGMELSMDTSTVSVNVIDYYPYYAVTATVPIPSGGGYTKTTTKDIKPIGTSLSVFVVF